MGSCLRTEDRLRSASRRVNGYSRNPDVLPTFLHVIPKRRRHHPQFFPMVNVSRRHPGAVAMGVAAMVAGVSPVLCVHRCARRRRGQRRTGLAHPLLRAARPVRPRPARLHHQFRCRPARSLHVPGGRALLPLHVAGPRPHERAGALGHGRGPVGHAHRRPARPAGVGRARRDVVPRRGLLRRPLHPVLQHHGEERLARPHVHRRRHQYRRGRPLHRLAGPLHLPTNARWVHRPARFSSTPPVSPT